MPLLQNISSMPCCLRLSATAVLVLPVLFLLLAALGAGYGVALAGGVVLALALAWWLSPARAPVVPIAGREAAGLFVLWLVLACWLIWVQRGLTYVYAHDVLLVPGIAQALTLQPDPGQAFAIEEPGRAYPPGWPVLLSPLAALVPGTVLFQVWNCLVQLGLAALPVLWALVLKRRFRVPLGAVTMALLLAASMLMLERMAVLGGNIKQAQHLGLGVVLPAILLLLPERTSPAHTSRGRLCQMLLCLLLVAAMASYYYTLLHLLLALAGGWWLADLLRRGRFRRSRFLSLVGLVACIALVAVAVRLMVPVTGDDLRFTGKADGPVHKLWRIFIDPAEPFLAPIVGDGWRRFMLAASFLLSVLLPLAGRSRRERIRLGRVAALAAAMMASLMALLVAVLLTPVSGLSFDYGRWLAWLPQLILLACPFFSLSLLLQARWPTRWRWLAVLVPLLLMLPTGLPAHLGDASKVRRAVADHGRPLAALKSLAAVLADEPPGCRIVAKSNPVLGGLHYIQIHAYADALEVIAPSCRPATGNFLHHPLPDARGEGGLPDAAGLERMASSGALLAYGGQELIDQLQFRQPTLLWQRFGPVQPGYAGLWRAVQQVAPQ